jgi:hypothetical protein
MMSNDIAESGRHAPFDFRHQRSRFIGKLLGCLADDLKITDDGIECLIVGAKASKSMSFV